MNKSLSDLTRLVGGYPSDRRTFLRGAGTAGLAGLAAGSLPVSRALARSESVVAIMPGVFIPDPARPIVEAMSGVKVENAPYVSPTDTLAKLMEIGRAHV